MAENKLPKDTKKGEKQGAVIFWLEEAGIRSDDPLQRTWGLKGQTPIIKTSGQRQSIDAISALSNKGGFGTTPTVDDLTRTNLLNV